MKLLDGGSTDYLFLRKPVWQRVSIGLLGSSTLLWTQVYRCCSISRWAREILRKVEVVSSPAEAQLVLVSVRELTGGKDKATWRQIVQACKMAGWSLCPAEVAPLLRVQYLSQPPDETIYIASEPIRDFRFFGSIFCSIFSLVHDRRGLWLDACNARNGATFSADDRFVFMKGTTRCPECGEVVDPRAFSNLAQFTRRSPIVCAKTVDICLKCSSTIPLHGPRNRQGRR